MAKEEAKSNPVAALNEYVLLGRSGLRVSPVCLGCMTFGEDWKFGTNLEESKKVYDLYRSKGGNFFDTANVYTNGDSERFLGQLVAGGARSDAVIATKYTSHPKFHPTNSKGDFVSPNGGGNSRKSLVENVDESLKRLGTGYIDLLYVHAWEGFTPVNEIMRSLDDVVRSGKVLYLAVSDVPAWKDARANTIADLRGWSSFIGLQTRYNLLERELEFELGPMAEEMGMSILPWGILAEGFLTGKHTKDEKNNESGRNESVTNHFKKDKNIKILEEVQNIAKEIGRSPAQVSLNWILQRPITIPIFGAKNVAQLQDNLAALEFTLTPEQMKRLNDVSAPVSFFPHTFGPRIAYFTNAGLKIKSKPNIWA